MAHILKWMVRFLPEFTDLAWIPRSLKHTVTEMIEAANSRFRSFNRDAADYVLRTVRGLGRTRILELGAGAAPLSRMLAARSDAEGLELVPSDRTPDRASFQELVAHYPGRVNPCFEPVDFAQDSEPDSTAVAVFLSTFHHLPEPLRVEVLKRFTSRGIPVVILEALRPDVASFFLCLTGFIGGIRLPFAMLDRPGKLRRFFWCWFVPAVPVIIVWDGVVSVLRLWNEAQWRTAHAALQDTDVELEVEEGACVQFVRFTPRRV